MRILIAYDGSACADAALEELPRAGLPADAEVIVLNAADVFLPPDDEGGDHGRLKVPAAVRRAHKRAAGAVKEARALAARAAAYVKTEFPNWDVKAEACADSPAWALVRRADEWGADLVIVGAHGHTVLGGRLILGSVSQRVLYEARCSVRVARASGAMHGYAPRIIIGMDGSPDSEAAVQEVARRTWPLGTRVRLVSVLESGMAVSHSSEGGASEVRWVEVEDEKSWLWVKEVFEAAAEKLHNAGLKARVVLRKGNPKQTLVKEAEKWRADSVFVGARGARGVDRLLLGSVSAAVAARAPCAVEVVRRPESSSRV